MLLNHLLNNHFLVTKITLCIGAWGNILGPKQKTKILEQIILAVGTITKIY